MTNPPGCAGVGIAVYARSRETSAVPIEGVRVVLYWATELFPALCVNRTPQAPPRPRVRMYIRPLAAHAASLTKTSTTQPFGAAKSCLGTSS